MSLRIGNRRGLLRSGAERYTYLWQYVAGLPTPLAWWQPKADSYGLWSPANLAGSYVNVANPGTYNAAPGTAPAWAAATGWTFTGASSQYLTTGLVPPNDQTWSFLVAYNNASGTTGRAFGAASGANRVVLIRPAGATTCLYQDGQSVSGTLALSGATKALCGGVPYHNGVADGVQCGAWAGSSDWPLFIGAQNNLGAATSYFSGTETLVAVWSSNIAAYIASLYTVLVAAGLTT